ncbi:MAG: DUF1311 domain-containing protein [Gemmatimonadota bacterium]|nr:DUF1311 domain-containing protein [Gemmatimonadota bacterium]
MRAIVASVIVASPLLLGCSRRAPDAGGDTSLARDLAEVQMDATARQPASDSGKEAASRQSAVEATTAPPLPAPLPKQVSPSAAIQHPAAPPARPVASALRRSADPCTSPERASQAGCLAASVRRSNARVASVYVAIVHAVRAEQHAAPAAPDPPYVSQLHRAQSEWFPWRDSECKRRTGNDTGKLWGALRAKCILQLTDTRVGELRSVLAQVRRP